MGNIPEKDKRNCWKYWPVVCFAVFLIIGLYFWRKEILHNKSMEKIDIIDEGRYVNPYAEYTETFSGGYLYDIYEANRGSDADGDWFIDGSERFIYYKSSNPFSDENRSIKWSIELAEMKGTSNLATEFNHYHNSLFEYRKEEMENEQEKVSGMNEDELNVSRERHGSQIYTKASFEWGNIFTVVDIVDPHYRGCSTVIANFNSESGKVYKLNDLFIIEDYEEKLIEIIKAELDGYDQGWSIELENPEWLSFVIGYRGLLLIDNISARSILIGWDKLKDILSQEILNELESTGQIDVWNKLYTVVEVI